MKTFSAAFSSSLSILPLLENLRDTYLTAILVAMVNDYMNCKYISATIVIILLHKINSLILLL